MTSWPNPLPHSTRAETRTADGKRTVRGTSEGEYISVAYLEGGLDAPATEDPVMRWLFDE